MQGCRFQTYNAPPLVPLLHPPLVALLHLARESAAASPPVSLNPFGSITLLASWAVLIAVNGYCLWRLLHPSSPARTEAAPAPPEEGAQPEAARSQGHRLRTEGAAAG